MGDVRHFITPDNKIKTVHTAVVHRFRVNHIEDPIVHAASPMYEWENSEASQFVMKFAEESPIWHQQLDPLTYAYKFAITAKMEEKKLSEFYLKFGKPKDL